MFAPGASIEWHKRFCVFVHIILTFKNTLLGPNADGKFCDFLACLVDFLRFLGMSQRDMKGGPIETKMVGIDRKALGQIFKDFL